MKEVRRQPVTHTFYNAFGIAWLILCLKNSVLNCPFCAHTFSRLDCKLTLYVRLREEYVHSDDIQYNLFSLILCIGRILSQKKPFEGSPEESNKGPSLANDGQTGTYYSSLFQPSPYWLVDLENIFSIKTIEMSTRTDR